MTETQVDSSFSKSKGLVFFEYVLLALCLCVIALRATFTEGLNVQSANLPINLADSVYSLSISTVLILSFVIWFVWSFCSRRFVYRFTAIEIGLAVFVLSAVLAGLAATNKRAAITNFVTLLAPILMAVLLVQILDSQSKVRLALTVIAALGMVSAWECKEQLFYWNEQDIKSYEQNPDEALAQRSIVPNSLQHWQFEHRLYSKDVKGFFTTSNSAGSFALLALFAAVTLFIEKLKDRKSDALGFFRFVTCGIAVAAVLFGLVITQSKGAIAALLIAAVMFIAYLLFGNWLKAHKKAILIVCLLLVVTVGCAVVLYGLAHDRLPGGNSMLVRWQYWRASAKMYADHLLTGVGPGNFAHFYTRYKPAQALETVADPHNFLLSVLTQYGPIGLVGFLALIAVPLWRAISHNSVLLLPKTQRHEPAFIILAVIYLIVVSIALRIIRPIILPLSPVGSIEEKKAAVIILYVMPVVVFIAGFLLLAAGRVSGKASKTNIAVAALFCAVAGFLIHNLIDFAIFEPGVFTTFWAIIAILIAMNFNRNPQPQFVLKPALFVRMIIVAGALVLIGAYFNYALIPVARAGARVQRAMRQPGYTHQLLDGAAEADRLDPAALYLNGRLYLQHYNETGRRQPALLERAADCFLGAIARDEADFKNYERLSTACNLLAEASTQQAKAGWLNKAFDSASLAVERYPVSARLRVKLAEVAEQLGKNDIAIANYRKAIDIEDSFRRQFQMMYPGREVISRLGEEKYQFAKQRIKKLSK